MRKIPKIIAMQVSKKSIKEIKRDLRKQGYCGLSSSKSGRWYNVYYTRRVKRGKC